MGLETLTSNFITLTLQLMQIHTGLLLQCYNTLHNLATDLWIKSLWEFVKGQNIQIKSPKENIPEKIRNHDKMIINDFIKYEFDEVDLVRLNRVRNHFKVSYVSDMTEGNGKIIKKSIFNGLQNYTTKNEYRWRQEKNG